ncbi:MAG: RNA pyrophosphohydrolase [Chlamydiae bacterium]|nr:RNA pyrophosphohydrolase [Chlamydiota bacterium]
MKNSLIIRNSTRVLLINDNNELLLLCAEDPATTTVEGKYHGTYWFPPGGEIEPGETFEEAVVRELREETGLIEGDYILGPIVWFGEFELILYGKHTLLKQKFIVAHTKSDAISLHNLTEDEKQIIKKCEWFSLEKIKNYDEVIYPVVLKDHLPGILEGDYPKDPIEIDLGKQPEAK